MKYYNTLAVAKGVKPLTQATTPGKILVILSAVTNVTRSHRSAKELQRYLQLSKYPLPWSLQRCYHSSISWKESLAMCMGQCPFAPVMEWQDRVTAWPQNQSQASAVPPVGTNSWDSTLFSPQVTQDSSTTLTYWRMSTCCI